MESEETTSSISEVPGTEAENTQNPASDPHGDGAPKDAGVADDNEPMEKVVPHTRKEILKALEAVERDSVAIAESFTSLFDSLRLFLSQATSSTVDHMNCFSDAAGRLQECVLDASTKGNRYINSCLRLNEEMKGMDTLATQLKILRRHVDALDTAVDRLVRFP